MSQVSLQQICCHFIPRFHFIPVVIQRAEGNRGDREQGLTFYATLSTTVVYSLEGFSKLADVVMQFWPMGVNTLADGCKNLGRWGDHILADGCEYLAVGCTIGLAPGATP